MMALHTYIRIAFEQAEKEVQDLHQRTREGIETARLNGKQIGQRPGNNLKVKKAGPAKEKILKYSKDFNGNLDDQACIKVVESIVQTFGQIYEYDRVMEVVLKISTGQNFSMREYCPVVMDTNGILR